VLTVGHGYSWVTAARFAAKRRLPLVFVVHDDWPRAVAPQLQRSVDRAFAGVYTQASARLCASPFMSEDYQRRYGAPGTVLMPYRGAEAPSSPATEGPSRAPDRPLVFAFAGTINSAGYGDLLRGLAESAARHQGRLIIFGPTTEAQGARFGLALPNVTFAGLLPPSELLIRMRLDADVLFAPMSFADAERANMRMGFPTKLPDYTATGLPLLIWGPPDCSAVRWARENDGVAALATTDDRASIDAAVDRLVRDAGYRQRLAAEARRIGDRDFSAAAAHATLHRALAGARLP
jgi:glycosyltransferase involved in cell wall biosynthesis